MNINYLFWEEIPENKYLLDVSNKSIYSSLPSITFFRDENYRLLYEIKADVKSEKIFGGLDELGLTPPFTASYHGQVSKIKIEVLGIVNLNVNPDIQYNDNSVVNKYTLTGEVHSLESIIDHDTDTYSKYWLLNSDDDFFWNSATEIDKDLAVKIKIGEFFHSTINLKGGSNVDFNSCALNINGKKFLFGKVEKKYSGKYLGSFIQTKVGYSLSESEVETIRYLLSFISGTPLIPLGKTIYTKDHMIAGKTILSSERYDIGQLVANSKQRIVPASYTLWIEGADWTKIIIELISKYHSMKEKFPLDEVVENIHTYRILPLRLKIQPLATAFDLLCDAWFKSDRSKSKGKNLQDKSYKAIINKYIENIIVDLGDRDSAAPIVNKIKYANNMSMNQRVSVFFEELGIDLTDNEKETIKTRNKIVHGISGKVDYNDIYIKTHGYYSILGKVILRLLDYEYLYMDYSEINSSGEAHIKKVSNKLLH